MPGIPVKKVVPEYPKDARASHIEGTVLRYALLSSDGTVQKVKVLQSAGTLLDQAALHAVQQWGSSPTDCGSGRRLPAEIEVTVNFALRY